MRHILTAVFALAGLRILSELADSTTAATALLTNTVNAIQHSPQVVSLFGNPSILLGAIYLLLCHGLSGEVLHFVGNTYAGLFGTSLSQARSSGNGSEFKSHAFLPK